MGLREQLFDVMRITDNLIRRANTDAQPFDPRKYHRAFLAGLYGLSAVLTAAFILIAQGLYVEAAGSILIGFMVPFSVQLLAEYGLKPSSSPG